MVESRVKGAERAELLEKAREYCDVKTGRVVRMIPEELTSELRRRQLMTGIFLGDGKPCKYLGTSAWWFVLLDRGIAATVLDAKQKLHKSGGEEGGTPDSPSPP